MSLFKMELLQLFVFIRHSCVSNLMWKIKQFWQVDICLRKAFNFVDLIGAWNGVDKMMFVNPINSNSLCSYDRGKICPKHYQPLKQ